LANYLKEIGVGDDDKLEAIRAELKAEMDKAVDEAWNAPDPEPESALRHVFAEEA
jgi:TPP-dependent pyruvate/acetoin dehydrogenase alpha subunit